MTTTATGRISRHSAETGEPARIRRVTVVRPAGSRSSVSCSMTCATTGPKGTSGSSRRTTSLVPRRSARAAADGV